jgi:signal transduction histidine kinase/streptogramin lyase
VNRNCGRTATVMKALIAAVGWICALPLVVVAQPLPLGNALPFVRVVYDPVGADEISVISEDADGMIWLGGREGLARFDGRVARAPEFVGVPAARIAARSSTQTIHRDARGLLWFSAEDQGLLTLDPRTLGVRRIEGIDHDVWTLADAADGGLWAGALEVGLLKLAADGRVQSRWPADQAEHCGKVPIQLSVDARGVWLGALDGLCRVEFETGQMRRVPLATIRAAPSILALVAEGDALLLGTRLGLLRFDPATGAESLTTPRPGNPRSLSHAQITALKFDRAGRLWVGTRKGLNLREADGFRRFGRLPDDFSGLRSDQISALSQDSYGALWVANHAGGAYRLSADFERFAIYRHDPSAAGGGLPADVLNHAISDHQGGLWVSSRRFGVVRYSLDTGAGWALDRDQSLAGQAWTVLPTPDAVWVSAHNVLRRLNPNDFRTEQTLNLPQVDLLASTIDGGLLAGSFSSGLYRVTPQATVQTIAFDRQIEQVREVDGRWLIAHQAGLSEWDGASVRPINGAPGERINAIGSEGASLALATSRALTIGTLTADRFTSTQRIRWPEALTPLRIGAIIGRYDGRWVMTSSRGLVIVDVDGGARVLDERYGLPCHGFSERPLAPDRHGIVYAALSCGVVAFRPERLLDGVAPPPMLKLLSFETERAGVTRAIDTSAPIALSHRDGALRFALTVLGADREPQIEVRLAPFDAEFSQVNVAQLERRGPLPPGRYTFEARSRDDVGRLGPALDPITLDVRPPPWATRGAQLSYALLLLIALAAVIYRLRARAQANREARAMSERLALAEEQRRYADELNATTVPQAVLDTLTRGLRRALPQVKVAQKLLLDPSAPRREGSGQLELRIAHLGRDVGAVEIDAGQPLSERDLSVAQGYRAQAEVALARAWLLLEAQMLADQADSANRAKGAFLAQMSHEIRTPLHGMLGMSELLERKLNDAESKGHLAALNRAGGALLGLLNDVLDLSQLNAGRREFKPIDIDLNVLWRELTALFEPAARERGLTLRGTLEVDTPPRLSGDRVALRQILMNLIGNAIKCSRSGEIHWHGAYVDGALKVDVRDQGPGIPSTQLPTLFDPFTQGESAQTAAHKGSGLGLAIVRALLDALNGAIAVESTVGQGTCFRLSLPLPLAPPLRWALGASADAPGVRHFSNVFEVIAAIGSDGAPDELELDTSLLSAAERDGLVALRALAPQLKLLGAAS